MAQRVERGPPERDGADDGPCCAQRRRKEAAAHGAEHEHVGDLREQVARTRGQGQRVLGLPSGNLFIGKLLQLRYHGCARLCQPGTAFCLEGNSKCAGLGVGDALGYAGKRKECFLECDRIMLGHLAQQVEPDASGNLMFDRETHRVYLPSASCASASSLAASSSAASSLL